MQQQSLPAFNFTNRTAQTSQIFNSGPCQIKCCLCKGPLLPKAIS